MDTKIDINPGKWPAWRTLGINVKWLSNGKIDIMEYYSKKLLLILRVEPIYHMRQNGFPKHGKLVLWEEANGW